MSLAPAAPRLAVPRPAAADLPTVLAALRDRPLVVLTGAGISTDSGIPDYRGPGSPARRPMTFDEFCSGPVARQRYWARSHLGWARMRRAAPNAGHRALAELEGRLDLLVTQNVDGLHEAAGSTVLPLHGRISDVVCLDCRRVFSRAALQEELAALNPGFVSTHAEAATRPDGDVELEDTGSFVVPVCGCGGTLKPDVVFFGENVPADRVSRCYAAVDGLPARDGALLVVGSSLAVMSGLRFVKRAHRLDVPVVIVNRGATRGDELAAYTLESGCSEFLTSLVESRVHV